MTASSTIWLTTAVLLSGTAQAAPPAYWMRSLGGGGFDRVLAADADGARVYWAGIRDLGAGPSNGWLFVTDAEGGVLWERVYSDDGGDSVSFDGVSVHDGIVYVAGGVGQFQLGLDAVVLALSPDGDVLWQQRLLDGEEEVVGDVLATDDGVLVVGARYALGDYRGDAWVVMLDHDGTIRWQRELATPGPDFVLNAIERRRGGYLLSGSVGVGKQPDNYQGWILALDEDGEIDWQKAYNVASSDSISGLVETSKGIWAGGTAFQLAFFRGEGWIMNLDSGGGLKSAELFGDFELLGNDQIVDVKPTSGQGFIVLGTTETLVGFFDQVWAARFDGRGRIRWQRHFGDGGFERAAALALPKGGGVAFGGWTQEPTLDHDGLVGKVDRHGRRLDGCDQTQELEGVLRPWTDTVVTEPFVTMTDTGALVGEANLVADFPSTKPKMELLCDE